MTRGECIRALIAAHDTKNGKQYEREDGYKMRWDEDDGPMLDDGTCLRRESGVELRSYREVLKPRTWGPWEEVEEWENAEDACDANRPPHLKMGVVFSRQSTDWRIVAYLPPASGVVPVKRGAERTGRIK